MVFSYLHNIRGIHDVFFLSINLFERILLLPFALSLTFLALLWKLRGLRILSAGFADRNLAL